MKKILITLFFGLSVVVPGTMYQQYRAASTAVEAQASAYSPTPAVLGASQEQVYFTVNVPSRFLGGITAPNVVYSVNGENGDIQIDNTLVAGSGISISDRTITNTGILTLVAGNGISVDGNKITNSGITSLSAGTGISIDGNKITNTYSFTPDYTQGGWTRTGTSVGLTTLTDSVTVGDLTAGAVTVDSLTTGGLSLTSDLTVSSGHSLLPSVDLGSDIGSSSFRFNNLWVANINSNSSQSFSGQTTFSYPPTDTTINQASVLINPTTSIANGQLLGLAIAGYEKAVIDEDGDIILGYNSLTSPPATDYPLDIYGHSGTRVAYVDTTGNGYFGAKVTASSGLYFRSASEYLRFDGTNSVLNSYYPLVLSTSVGSTNPIIFKSNNSEAMRITSSGNVGIGTTSPGVKLDIAGGGEIRLVGDSGWTSARIYDGGSSDQGWLQLLSGNSAKVNITADNTQNTYFNAGNVGIGTTSPTSKLHVSGAVTGKALAIFDETGNQDIFTASASGVTKLVVTNSGNVGIGTTSPTDRLQVEGSGHQYVRIKTTSSGYTSAVYLNGGNTGWSKIFLGSTAVDSSAFIFQNNSTNNLKISSASSLDLAISDTPAISIISSRNVGIGTTSPTSKLHVSGAVTGKALAIFDETGNQDIFTASASGVTKLVVTNSGNVGIGTTSPGAKLDIQNSTNYSSSSYGLKVLNQGVQSAASQSIYGAYVKAQRNNDSSYNNGNITGLYVEAMNNTGREPNNITGIEVTNTGLLQMNNGYIYGIKINPMVAIPCCSMTTTTYGLYIGSVSGGTNNYGLYSNGGTNYLADNLGIGTTAPGEKLEVAGNIKTSSLTTGTVYSNAGVLTNTDPSDINLKTNVLTLPDGTLNKVLGLRTVSYNWKSTGDGALGFIAQEVQNIFPELVGTNQDGTLGLYTTQFIPLLTKAIQEQQLQIDEVRLSSASAAITNEEWDGVNTLMASIQAAIEEIKQKLVAITERFRTKELCLGDDTSETCVTKEQLDELIKLIPSPTPSISPSPSPIVSSEPSPSPSIEPSPTASASAEPAI